MQTMQSTTPVLRVTPLVVLDEIGPALGRYEDLGFQRVDSGADGCIGLASGNTSVILATADFMRGDYDAAHVSRLVGQTVKYIHVTSVEQVVPRLSAAAHILQDVRTRGGTREVLVTDDNDLLILAEVVA
jgi:hypothetical protein